MLTRHFENSKPIHTFFCVLAIAFSAFMVLFYVELQEFNLKNFGLLTVNILILLATIFLLEFVKSKNRLTKRSSFAIITFSAILIAFPETLSNTNLLLSNFFVLLSLRRLLSLRTKAKVKKKILDSAIWVAIASLFFNWAILFFIPVFISMVAFVVIDKKTIWIPFIGAAAVLLFLITYNVLFFDTFWINDTFSFKVRFDISTYFKDFKHIQFSILFLVILWLLLFSIKTYQKLRVIYRPLQITIWCYIFITLSILIISNHKNSGEVIFLAPVLSYAFGSYLDFSKHKIFQNIIFIMMLVLPVLGILGM